MTGTLKLLLTLFLIRRTAQMCTARENDKHPIRRFHNPYTPIFLEFGIYANTEISRCTDTKNSPGFKNRSWEKEPQEHQEVCK